MAIDKGNIKTSANYDVRAQKPIDGRSVRPTKADLIKKESWSSDGSTVYVYEGMQVYVEDEKKTYYLKDLSKMFATDFSGWELMGTGAGGSITEEKEVYIGSEEPPVGAKLWIDPQGTPSSPSSPSAGGGVKTYKFPILMYSFLRTGGFYRFNSEETAAFKNAWANRDNTRFILDVSDGDLYTEAIVEFPFFGRIGGNYYLHTPTQAFIDNYNYQGIMIEELSETELKAVFD